MDNDNKYEIVFALIIKWNYIVVNGTCERSNQVNLNSKITLTITNFFKKHGLKILVVFIIWLIIFIINQNLKSQPKYANNTNTYNPDQAVMVENGNVPNRYRADIRNVIENYFYCCKTGDYQGAYSLISNDCKEFLYDNNISNFIDFVSSKINSKKTYYIQNYSNVNEAYIYDLYIIDDIETTGGTGGYNEYKDKITLKKENGNFKLSNQSYIGKEELNISNEDENMKVKIDYRNLSYQREYYNANITNKTDKYILISDGTYVDSVTINLGDQKRNATNTQSATFVVPPNSSKDFIFAFDKFADDGKKTAEINFNNVRLYTAYNTELKPEDAEKLYSFNIHLK